MRRRSLVAAAALLPLAARAQDKWPARPIKLVVPFAAGGTTDFVARLVAPPMSQALGHLAGVWFNALTGGDLVHVPYRGSGPALQDLLAGRVHVLFDNIPTALSQVQSGSVRALAVTASTRAAVLPDVPSVREAGLPEFEILSWTILLAPATTATATIDAANAALNAALRDSAVRSRFAEAGVDARGGSAADAAAFLRTEIAKWRPIAKRSGVVLD